MSSVGSAGPTQRHKELLQAAAAGREDLVRQLVSDSQWQSPMERDALRQALQRVAARGNVSFARFLIENGAEVNSRKDSEVASLFRAAENGHARTVQLLLENGANIDAVDRYGRTSLFPAALKGYIEVVKLLLEAGAKVNARDKELKRTVLIHLAAERLFQWNEAMCVLLLEKGADVEAKDASHKNPLIWAAATGKVEMVRLLVEGRSAPRALIEA
jgi:ankyrin repeat protein